MRFLDIVLLSVVAVSSLNQLAIAESSALKGRVLDSEGNPIAGVKIVVHDEDRQEETTGRSDGKGNFEVKHEPCNLLSFDVFPSHKSGFSHAHYAHVSGEVTKQFIVRLHKGFEVTGRILAEGEGIKGLEIKIIGKDDGNGTSHSIHGGGVTKTKNGGEYAFHLTPGKKILQIKNDVYSNLSPIYQHEITITGDVRLPDMTLPLLKHDSK